MIKTFCLALALILTLPVHAGDDRSPVQLAQTHGYVYVAFREAERGWQLTLESESDHRTYDIEARTDASVNAYGAWLPAGDYRIKEWNGQAWGDYPSFHVEAGRVTDLGELVRFSLGGLAYVMLPIQHPDLDHNVDAAIKQFQPALVSPEPIRWQPTTPPKPMALMAPQINMGLAGALISTAVTAAHQPPVLQRLREATTIADFYRLAVSGTPPTKRVPAMDDASNLYYGADFGQVRVRHPDGRWESLDTGTFYAITAIAADGQRLLAGSVRGAIRVSNDHGATWSLLKQLPGQASIYDIRRVSGRWLMSVIETVRAEPAGPTTCHDIFKDVHLQCTLTIYSASADNFSDLAPIAQVPVELSHVTWTDGRRPTAQLAGSSYYVDVIPDLYRLDLDTMAIKKISPPNRVDGFSVAPGNEIIGTYRDNGLWTHAYISTDRGENWKQIDTPGFPFWDLQFDGVAAGWSLKLHGGGVQTFRYHSEKGSWSLESETTRGCYQPLRDGAGAFAYCVTPVGNILARTAGGELKLEFEME